MKLVTRYLELLNATLGLSLLLVTLIIINEFKKEFLSKDKKIKIVLALLGLGILVFSIKELYKYGPFEEVFDPVIAELLETLYLLLTLAAFFSLLRVKELPAPNIKN